MSKASRFRKTMARLDARREAVEKAAKKRETWAEKVARAEDRGSARG